MEQQAHQPDTIDEEHTEALDYEPPRHQTYRLTTEDEQRILRRVTTVAGDWRHAQGVPAPFTASDVLALERIAAGAIGCSLADLRLVELEWVTVQCLKALGLR